MKLTRKVVPSVTFEDLRDGDCFHYTYGNGTILGVKIEEDCNSDQNYNFFNVTMGVLDYYDETEPVFQAKILEVIYE